MKKTPAVLMIFLFVASGNAYAQAPALPTLPQKMVSLTLPTQGTSTCPTLTTGSNCIRSVPSGSAASFQSAINAATCGDTIVLVAGSTYSGNFTIPSTSCSGWIEIVSSALTSLPASGNRVGPSNASNMPIISTPNTYPAIAFLPNSNHWRLIGLEITTSDTASVEVYNLTMMGFLSDDSTSVSVASQLPDQIIFDRDYFFGTASTSGSPWVDRAMNANTQSFAVVDSYCDGIVDNGQDTQCILSTNGTGPFLVQNNFLQAAGENILFGGDDPKITNLVPSDITVIGNFFQHNLAWRGVISDVKNFFELKNAQRVLVDGNVFQYEWAAGQPYAMLLRSVNQEGACTWCVVQDVTVTHNLMQHLSGGIIIDTTEYFTGCGCGLTLPTQRVLLQNNLLLDVSGATWGTNGGPGIAFAASTTTAMTAHDWIIDHNTVFSDQEFLEMGDAGTVNNFQFTNNIGDYSLYGVIGAGTVGSTTTLNTFATNYVYNDIVIINATGNPASGFLTGTYWSTLARLGFTSVSGTNPNLVGNFQLTSISPYYRAGTDGKDIGVWDWTCLNNDSTAALAGTFVPSPGCALSGNLLPQPPTNLSAVIH